MVDMPYTDKSGRIYAYGEYYPIEMSPWAYNETLAQEYFPLTKEEAITQGYRWRDPDTKEYVPTIAADVIPNDIEQTEDSITKEILACAHAGECNHNCTKAFRIIPDELSFYKKIGVPLPTLCSACRTMERLKFRLGLELHEGACMCNGEHSKNNNYANAASHDHGATSCPRTFQTGYDPKNGDIVYCEHCYQQEVS